MQLDERSPVTARVEGDRVAFGETVAPKAIGKLGRTPNPAEIFESLDSLNEEIEESYPGMLGGKEAPQVIGTVPKTEKVKRNINSKASRAETSNPEVKNKPIMKTKSESPMPVKNETSLADALDTLAEETEAPEKTQAEVEAEQKEKLMEMLGKLPDGPTEQKINFWKQAHGKDGVHVTVFSEKEIYVYTHLTRAMWAKVQETISKLQSTKNSVGEEELKETVVKHCMLFPTLSTEWKYNSRAGVVDSLYQAISLHSYFLSPAQIMSLTFEL